MKRAKGRWADVGDADYSFSSGCFLIIVFDQDVWLGIKERRQNSGVKDVFAVPRIVITNSMELSTTREIPSCLDTR
jgi:hypothetical protein